MKNTLILIVLFLIITGILTRKRISRMINNKVKLASLNPAIKQRVENFLVEAAKMGIYLKVTFGHRSFSEQQEMYNLGRVPVKNNALIVTNAMPGQSLHNYGLAFDVVELKNGVALWDNPNWEKIGKLGEKFGFTWGGRWKPIGGKIDYPHFEDRLGKSIAYLQSQRNIQGKDVIDIA